MYNWITLCTPETNTILSVNYASIKTNIYMCVCNECNIYIYAAKWRQLCSTLCDPIDGSPPGSSVPGILQARTLEWVAISFSNARKWKAKVKSLSRVQLLATPWTAAHQAPPSMAFSRQESWNGVPLPSPKINTKHQISIHHQKTMGIWN